MTPDRIECPRCHGACEYCIDHGPKCDGNRIGLAGVGIREFAVRACSGTENCWRCNGTGTVKAGETVIIPAGERKP